MCRNWNVYLRSKAEAGQNVGILLKGVNVRMLLRVIYYKKNTIYSYSKFKAKYIFIKEEGGRRHPFKKNINYQFYIRTADLTGSLNLTMI